MPTSTARAALLRDLCQALHAGQDVPPIGTSDALGSTTTLEDTAALAYASADVNLFDGVILRIDEAVASGPAAGEFFRVNAAGLTVATGVVTGSPALTNPIQTGTDYSLWRLIHPTVAENLLNRVLSQNLTRQTYVPITLVTDGDQEAADASDWTGTTATLSKVTAAARVRHGAQAQRIEGNAGNPRSESAAIRVVEQDVLIASAAMMADVGVATFIAWDSTNGAEIDSGNHNEEAFQELWLPNVNIPAGCEELTIRLEGTGSSDDLYVDDVVIWPRNRREFVLPSYIEDPDDILALGYFRQGRALVGTNAYMLDESELIPWPYRWKPQQVEEGGAHPFRIALGTPITRPLYMFARRPFDKLTADTDSTTADARLVVLLTQWHVYQTLADAARAEGDADTEAQWLRARDSVGNDSYLRAGMMRHGKRDVSVKSLRMGFY